MKHRTSITPLNCNFDVGMNSFMKMELSEYTAATDRSIYCKDPDVSWFKMKAVTATPYIEPALFGLLAGDVITIEFDALVISGSINNFYASFRQITSAGGVGGVAYTQELPNGSLTSHYKHFKIPFVVMPDISGGDGILLNIRHNTLNSEMVIKNIEIEIDSANLNFSLKHNVAEYKNKKDYLDCIKLIGGTDLNTAYNSLNTVYTNGQITFPDLYTMSVASSGSSGLFKGLLGLLSASKYYQPQVVYLEYKNNDATTLSVASRDYDNGGSPINLEVVSAAPVSAEWRKAVFYYKGRAGDKRNVFLNIGKTNAEISVDIRNVRFSLPRFDDVTPKREPNNLAELYSNLGSKLRA